MFIDTGTLIAIVIALVSQMIVMILSVRAAARWEQQYHRIVRLLKTERADRR